jgi:U3 small nucleolar RNA-associated protein 13
LIICLAVYTDRSTNISYLASSSKDNQIILWKISSPNATDEDSTTITLLSDYTFEKLQVCQGHTQDVGALSFSKQSFQFLVSGSIDTTIKLWRCRDEAEKKTAAASTSSLLSVSFTIKAHEKDINSVCVSPNDKLFASGSTDKTAKVYIYIYNLYVFN